MVKARSVVVFGVTAAHARSLARSAMVRILLCGLGALLGAFVAFRLLLASSQGWRLGVLALCGVVVFVCSALVGRFHGVYQRAMSGVRAEQRVEATIRRSRAVFALVNGAVFGRGDVDHVVLGPCCAAIETKAGRGPVTVDKDGRLRVAGRVLPRDPLGQTSRNASTVSRHLNVPTIPVLVVVDATSPVQRIGEVLVCSRNDLSSVLTSLPATLDETRALRLAESLPVARRR